MSDVAVWKSADQLKEGDWIVSFGGPQYNTRITEVSNGRFPNEVMLRTDYGYGGAGATTFYRKSDRVPVGTSEHSEPPTEPPVAVQ